MNSSMPLPRSALVVDDNQFTLKLLCYALEDVGYETTVVDHGSSAMALLAERHFDVLLADVNLPDMNGLVLCDTARELYEDRIAILVMSGQELERWAVTALQVCADDFLSKPFDLDELLARVEAKVYRLPKAKRGQEDALGIKGRKSQSGNLGLRPVIRLSQMR